MPAAAQADAYVTFTMSYSLCHIHWPLSLSCTQTRCTLSGIFVEKDRRINNERRINVTLAAEGRRTTIMMVVLR